MNEKSYKRRLDFQKNLIARQSEQIESLKSQIDDLNIKLKEKDETINSVEYLREELKQNIEEIKKQKVEYKALIEEIKKMKEILNVEIYRGRWNIIKFLIK